MQPDVGRKRVCDVLGAPRSTIYAREAASVHDGHGEVIALPKRGPRTELSGPRPHGADSPSDQRQPVLGLRPPQGQGPAATRARHSRGQKAGPAPHAPGGASGAAARQEAAQGTQPRRHDHPFGPGSTVGHGYDHGVDQEGRLGVGVLLRRSLLRGGVDHRRQERRRFRLSRAALRRGHRALRKSRQGSRSRHLVQTCLGTPKPHGQSEQFAHN